MVTKFHWMYKQCDIGKEKKIVNLYFPKPNVNFSYG